MDEDSQQDELIVLESIYDKDFQRSEGDGGGQLTIQFDLPHPIRLYKDAGKSAALWPARLISYSLNLQRNLSFWPDIYM